VTHWKAHTESKIALVLHISAAFSNLNFGTALAKYSCSDFIITKTKGEFMSLLKKSFITFITIALTGSLAFAQGQAAQQAAGSAEVSEQMLNKFVSIQPKIGEIATEYESELQGVQNTEKAQEIQTKYNGKMVKAIEDKGMSASDYNMVSNAVNSDPEVRDRYMEKIQ